MSEEDRGAESHPGGVDRCTGGGAVDARQGEELDPDVSDQRADAADAGAGAAMAGSQAVASRPGPRIRRQYQIPPTRAPAMAADPPALARGRLLCPWLHLLRNPAGGAVGME